MRLKTVLICFLLGYCTAKVCAQTVVNVDITQQKGAANPGVYAVNFHRGMAPNVASNTTFKMRVKELAPAYIRYHAAEQKKPGDDKNWIDFANRRWDKDKINAVLRHHPQNTKAMITISGWPNWMADPKHPQKLNPNKKGEYAAFCAQLVDIVNNQLKHKVTYWEPFNEMDGGNGYVGSSDMWHLADIHKKCYAAMKRKDPTIKIVGGAFRQPWSEDIKHFLYNLQNTNTLDVFSYHHYVSGGSTDTKNLWDRAMGFAGAAKHVRRQLDGKGFTGVPLWLGEWNIFYAWNANGYAMMTNGAGAIFDLIAYKSMIEGGDIDVAMAWNMADGRYGKTKRDFSGFNPGGHLMQVLRKEALGTMVSASANENGPIVPFAVRQSNGALVVALANRSKSAIKTKVLTNSWWWPRISRLSRTTIHKHGADKGTFDWKILRNEGIEVKGETIEILVTQPGYADRRGDEGVLAAKATGLHQMPLAYPNPTSNWLQWQGKHKVTLFDMMGKPVINTLYTDQLSLQGLAKGTYLLLWPNGEVQRIILN